MTIDAQQLGRVFESVDQADVKIEGFTFAGGNHSGGGGAIILYGGAAVALTDCVFAGNSSTLYGGAVFQDSGRLTVISCTFSGNGADDRGGCFYMVNGADLIMSNTILAFSSHGAGAWGWGNVSGSCNDVFVNVGGDFVGPLSDLKGTDGNFASDPIFCGGDTPEARFSLDEASLCTAENNPTCALVGAWTVVCSGSITGTVDHVHAVVNLAPSRPNPFNPRTMIDYEIYRLPAPPVSESSTPAAA